MLSFWATSDLIVAGSCFGSPTSTSLRDAEGAPSEGLCHQVMPEGLCIPLERLTEEPPPWQC